MHQKKLECRCKTLLGMSRESVVIDRITAFMDCRCIHFVVFVAEQTRKMGMVVGKQSGGPFLGQDILKYHREKLSAMTQCWVLIVKRVVELQKFHHVVFRHVHTSRCFHSKVYCSGRLSMGSRLRRIRSTRSWGNQYSLSLGLMLNRTNRQATREQ